jgi:hypothetical protein
LSLLQVNDDLEVVLQLLNAADGFALLVADNVELFLQLSDIRLVPLDELFQVEQAFVGRLFLLVHLESDVTLLHDLVELLLDNRWTSKKSRPTNACST